MQVRIVKKGLRAGVDKNGMPTDFVWEVDRIITFDDDTSSIVPAVIPLTDEELVQHVGEALAKTKVDIEADGVKRAELQEQIAQLGRDLATEKTRVAVLAEKLDAANGKLVQAFQAAQAVIKAIS